MTVRTGVRIGPQVRVLRAGGTGRDGMGRDGIQTSIRAVEPISIGTFRRYRVAVRCLRTVAHTVAHAVAYPSR